MKTKPLTLPIDPNKTYVARNGVKTIGIVYDQKLKTNDPIHVQYSDGNIRWLYRDGSWGDKINKQNAYDLIAEVIPDEQPKKVENKERDWSDVVEELLELAEKCRYFDESMEIKFKAGALAILQEFDRQHLTDKSVGNTTEAIDLQGNITTENKENEAMSQNVTEPTTKDSSEVESVGKTDELELVIGEMYEDTYYLGVIFYIGINPVDKGFKIFVDSNGDSHNINEDYLAEHIRKHVPKPVEREIEFWVNIYPIGRPCAWNLKTDADRCAGKDRIACLHIKRSFVDGEGL